MKLIIKNAVIVDPQSSFFMKKADLKITDGIIESIAGSIPDADGYELIERENLHVSEGWFDSGVSFGEPGFEHRETIANGLEVAAKSGFTGVALQPSTFPVADSQAVIGLMKSKASGSATDVFPIGALTKHSEGKDLAELFDMKNTGAVAFGDYKKNLANANLMKIALQYTQDFDSVVIAFCEDADLRGKGVANEGVVATNLGLKGIPALAEELMVARNLFLLEYTGGKMLIPTISTARSLELIRSAKAKGLQVFCTVSVHHLTLTEKELEGFDANSKVSPPLRSDYDRAELIKGVLDGTIDAITSDHDPIDIELKKMEFDLAANGTIGLESAFGALLGVLPMAVAVEKLIAGKTIFGIDRVPVAENAVANLTLFDPDAKYVFSAADVLSKSKNSAFLHKPMHGRVYGIINRNKISLK